MADISQFPVWEFASDEEGTPDQDETWVRPVDAKVVPAGAFSLSVAAKFKTTSGAELSGIVGVTTFGGLEIEHGAVITAHDYVFIPWPGYDGAHRSCQVAANKLGIPESELFPLQYELLVPVAGFEGPVSGEYFYSDAAQVGLAQSLAFSKLLRASD
ncbi:hypothetical protein [Ideonella sp.]|uniref:hypothetical protein n=1 Tax=Ideonella sp. TaxID=1929293 RepID=UPI003BB4EF3E